MSLSDIGMLRVQKKRPGGLFFYGRCMRDGGVYLWLVCPVSSRDHHGFRLALANAAANALLAGAGDDARSDRVLWTWRGVPAGLVFA